MESLQGGLQASLDELRRLTNTEFAALAWMDPKEPLIRWKHASGSRNGRYKRIALPPGKGEAGQVMRSGRPLVITSFSPRSVDDPWQYPILLAENLKAIVCVPVIAKEHIRGVLLVGCRHPRDFPPEVVELVGHMAEQLGTLLRWRGDGDAAIR